MINFKTGLAVLTLTLAFGAFGYEGGDDYTQWMRLSASWSYWNDKVWYDPSIGTGTKVAPESGKYYYVPSGYTLNIPKASSSDFAGSKLAIQGVLRNPNWGTFGVAELIMLPGFQWTPSSIANLSGVSGTATIRVEGTSSQPAYLKPFLYGSNVHTWKHDFVSDSDKVLYVQNSTSGTNAKTKKFDRESAYASFMCFTGDWSGYQGTVLVTTNTYFEINAPGHREFGGYVLVDGGYFGFMSNSGEFKMAKLEVRRGGELRCYGESGISTRCVYVISEKLSFSGTSYIYYEGDLPFGQTPIITLTGNAAKTLPDLSYLSLSPYSCGGYPPENTTFEIVSNDDGTKTIMIVRENKTVIHSGETLTSSQVSGTEDYGVLVMENNSSVYFKVPQPSYEGSVIFTVSDRLEVQGNLIVGMSSLPTNDAITVFRLSAAAAAKFSINLNQIQFDPDLMVGNLPENPHAELVANEDGTTDVRMIWTPMKHMIVSNTSYDYAHSAFNPANKHYWADGELPAAGYNGTVFIHGTLMAQQYAELSYPDMSILAWPVYNTSAGTVSGVSFRPHVYSFTMKGFYMLGSGAMSTYSGPKETALHFPIYFKSTAQYNTMYFYVRDSRKFVLHEPFDGDYDVYTQIDNGNAGLSYLELVAPNTNFYGRIIVTSPSKALPGEAKHSPVQLIVHDGKNLGGPYGRDDGYGWKAFAVNRYMSVSNAEDFVFNEPTRGMSVDIGAILYTAADRRFEIDVPIAYHGEIRKMCPGTLTLGGEAKFVGDDGKLTSTPIEGSNVLSIVEGALCITATNAIDGVALKMASGTKLILNPTLAGAAKTLGAKSCREGSSITADDGAIAVEFDSEYQPTDLRVECGIVTVPSERAGELSFSVPSKYMGRAVELKERTNADGTVTFYLMLAGKSGFCVYFEQEK